jgi:hypothetical protein
MAGSEAGPKRLRQFKPTGLQERESRERVEGRLFASPLFLCSLSCKLIFLLRRPLVCGE